MKKLFAFIGIIILVIPSVLSGYFYGKALKEEKAREKLFSVTVISPDSKEYVYTVADEGGKQSDEIIFFKSFSLFSEKSDKSTDELAALGKIFTIKYATTHGEHITNVYTLKKDNGYLIYFSSANGIYCFDEKARNTFLSSEFALCIYDSSALPMLNVSGSVVSPSKAEWKIKTTNGNFSSIDTSYLVPNTQNIKNYTGASSLSFSVAPDTYTVTVKDTGGNILFTGDSYAFSEFKVERSKDIVVDIDAVWYQSGDKNYYGRATYSFAASVVADPSFYLSAAETQPGSALLLSCINIPEDANITAEIYPEMCKVNLYRDMTNVYTFIPVSYNTAPGSYTIKISFGFQTEILHFTVTDKKYSTVSPFSQSLISTERVNYCLSEEAVAEYNALLKSVASTESNTLYYNGIFNDYQKLFSIYKGFGYHLTFAGSELTTRNDGVYFTAAQGSILTAMGDGKVCAVGECAYLGKYVAVDHGYGLRSWYVTLGEISCSVGDTVQKGTPLGKCGNTGLALQGKVLVMITVGDTPVSPYSFWEENINFIK